MKRSAELPPKETKKRKRACCDGSLFEDRSLPRLVVVSTEGTRLSLVHMKTVNMHEAKTHLSRLVEEVAKGEEIIIAKAGKPCARLVACEPVKKKPRKFGWLKGQIWISDDFDAPLSDEELRLWGEK
jgi:prevent-host-death family protein